MKRRKTNEKNGKRFKRCNPVHYCGIIYCIFDVYGVRRINEMERRRIFMLNYNVHYIVSCIALVVALTFPCMQAEAMEEREIKTCDFTCYIDSGTCFTGCQTRRGIAASSEALIGYTAVVWTTDGEFLGYYEILDKIGTKWGRSGTLDEPHVIDIWCDDLEEAKRLMDLTDGKCKVMFVKAEG